MPCYAVATATSTVNNSVITQLLTKDLIREIIDLVASELGIEVKTTHYDWHKNWITDITLPGGTMVGVAYLPNGGIGVSIKGFQTPEAIQLKEALEEKIGAVGAALLNEKIAGILAQTGAVNVQTSYKPNGVAVTKFQV